MLQPVFSHGQRYATRAKYEFKENETEKYCRIEMDEFLQRIVQYDRMNVICSISGGNGVTVIILGNGVDNLSSNSV